MIYAMVMIGLLCRPAGGQYFSNPSFEGNPGISVSPPYWMPFDEESTPDTEPYGCYDFPASDGNTYLILITRGPGYHQSNSVENAMTPLLKSLAPENYYRLTVDLASREDVGHFSWEEGFIAYTSPVKIKIYGSESELHKGVLLAESDSITNPDWKNYSLILAPQTDIKYLLVEAGMYEGYTGMGNLLLDRIHLEELDEPPLDFGDLRVPNVFTPNGDGVNDRFTIRGLPNGSSLTVYNRLGIEVFKSDSYEQNWDGKDMTGQDLDTGTYWFVLLPSDMDEVVKGLVYLKRE
jgi:gliding motility-associated-like protein